LQGYDTSSLRVLGSVGEPINEDAWRWYYEKVGQSRCVVVDTYWQTETGGHVITPIPGGLPTKPGSATKPFFGISAAMIDSQTGEVVGGYGDEGADGDGREKEARIKLAGGETNDRIDGVLVLTRPWPGMARSIWGDHEKFLNTYYRPYPGYYFTGDRASRDADGYYWIRGRVDDVINVSGHRLSTAEIEGALAKHPRCAEAAVLGRSDAITGQAIWAFCILKNSSTAKDDTSSIVDELRSSVRSSIGAFASPKEIIIVDDLPKTRSGKIMRRLVRRILEEGSAADLGDTSTLNNPGIIPELIRLVEGAIARQDQTNCRAMK
jgi:acetyl-CoA synthetase